MKKMIVGIVLLLLSVGLIGCSDDASVKEIDPEELLARIQKETSLVPIGEIPIPEDNPMKPEVIELGHKLFFDPRLSGNNDRSCAFCHEPSLGYGDNRPTFQMIDGSDGARNSPTIINSGYYEQNFWDGRADSLEEQALGPIENPNEMNQNLNDVVQELKEIKGYPELFQAAFNEEITLDNIAKALAAFEREIVVTDTPFDRFLQGDTTAMTQQELRGLDLFTGKAICSNCHNGPNLSDDNFYNLGVNTEDEGLYVLTKKIGDLGKIRTSGLYGITHTAPYMHDGSLATLEEVIDFYDQGAGEHQYKSFYFNQPLDLTNQEKEDLLAFLKCLGGQPPLFEEPELPGM